jgi:2-oxoglutarate/2-oxoacid ferredoxin oxidoreductase subunit beta
VINENSTDMHAMNHTPKQALNQFPYEKLTPGSKGLEKIMSRYR